MARLSPIGSEEWYMDIQLRGVSRVYREHGITAKRPVVGKTGFVHAEDGNDDKLAERREETEELRSIMYES
jgi:hypothetical protein